MRSKQPVSKAIKRNGLVFCAPQPPEPYFCAVVRALNVSSSECVCVGEYQPVPGAATEYARKESYKIRAHHALHAPGLHLKGYITKQPHAHRFGFPPVVTHLTTHTHTHTSHSATTGGARQRPCTTHSTHSTHSVDVGRRVCVELSAQPSDRQRE